MQKMEAAIEQRVIAGKISAAKRKQKQIEQLKQLEINLSVNDSRERPLNECSTSVQQIKENKIKVNLNKVKKINSQEDEAEKFDKLNQYFLEKQLSKDLEIEKLENLAQANIHSQVVEI
ncbi:hypothetical protein [Aliarcobacter butzleri]|uniref:hypothetical protein n=1 Tax=Aliarcobacter butzleri TaxID=28197 RepID=UPI003AFA41E0